MPPKRKAPLAPADSNAGGSVAKSGAKKAKTTNTEKAAEKTGGKKTFKYSKEDSLEKKFPKIVACHWGPTPSEEESESESDDDEERDGDDDQEKESSEKAEKSKKEVKDKSKDDSENITTQAQIDIYGEDNRDGYVPAAFKTGHCVTQSGLDKYVKIINECRIRDQDNFDMYIYNNWSGYGCIEVIENALAEFNKDVFKKTVSPVEKWSHFEGLVTWFKLGDVYHLMMSDDSDGQREIFSLLIPMYITCLDILTEHNLVKAENTPAFNINILTLILLEVLKVTCADYDIEDIENIVQAADLAGVKLVPQDGVKISEDDIEQWRLLCEIDPEDDSKERKSLEKAWRAKWGWKKLYKDFAVNHKGGEKYNLEKKSKQWKKQYEFTNMAEDAGSEE